MVHLVIILEYTTDDLESWPISCTRYLPSATQLRRDVENVTARLRYMSDAKGTVKDDISLTKRVTEKTAADVAHAQEEKQKQVCRFNIMVTMVI